MIHTSPIGLTLSDETHIPRTIWRWEEAGAVQEVLRHLTHTHTHQLRLKLIHLEGYREDRGLHDSLSLALVLEYRYVYTTPLLSSAANVTCPICILLTFYHSSRCACSVCILNAPYLRSVHRVLGYTKGSWPQRLYELPGGHEGLRRRAGGVHNAPLSQIYKSGALDDQTMYTR